MVEIYFSHHVRFPETSFFRKEFYKNADKLTQKNRNLLFKAYRGAAKTTLISRLYTIYKTAVKQEKRNAIIISATITLSKKTLEFIRNEFEENELFIKDFGIAKGDKWTEEEIVFYSGNTPFKISVFGSGKKIRGENWRGFRPDLIIGDDLENDENVETKAQRDKLYNWFEKAIMKLPARGDETHNIIIVGTTLHYDSLLFRIEARRDFKTLSYPLVREFPSNIDADKPDLSEFILDDSSLSKTKYWNEFISSKAAFMSEYQNTPLSREETSFSGYETFDIMPVCDAYYMGIDPALGKSKGDYFSVATLGYLAGKFYASVKMLKLKPELMLDRIIGAALDILRLNRPLKIAIETIQFQEFFLTPPINNAQILIDKNSLIFIDELDTYPKSAHDDGLDSLEMAWRIAKVPNFDYEKVNAILQKQKDKEKFLRDLLGK